MTHRPRLDKRTFVPTARADLFWVVFVFFIEEIGKGFLCTRARAHNNMLRYNASGENAERDLYADLVEDCGGNGETLVRTQNVALGERVRMHENEILSLRLQLQDVGEANVRLKDENLTLEKNISCLYKTALLVRTSLGPKSERTQLSFCFGLHTRPNTLDETPSLRLIG
jgi:hypothetical protein